MNHRVKYLDPKNDLTFRRIFSDHPHLLISFLNNLLPLSEGQLIESIEYLDVELIPELPGFKRSMVDVRCKDNYGRYFVVEMQMYWTSSFRKRVLFNAGKAYVKQLRGGGKYRDLKPVYALSLIDDNFLTGKNLENEYYHHYSLVHALDKDERIEGLELIFVELPKFKAQQFSDKRLRSLWLRFLTEIDENTREVSEDLKNDELIREALECVQQQAFSEEEMLYYEQYWDSIRIEKATMDDLEEKQAKIQILTEKKEEAEKQKEEAEKQKEEAEKQKEEAEKQKEEAEKQKEEAEKQKEEAEKQKEEAEKQKEEAEKQKEEAIAKLFLSARQMKIFGMPFDAIQNATGLSLYDIENIN